MYARACMCVYVNVCMSIYLIVFLHVPYVYMFLLFKYTMHVCVC